MCAMYRKTSKRTLGCICSILASLYFFHVNKTLINKIPNMHTCFNSSSNAPALMTRGPLTAYSIFLTHGFMFSTVTWVSLLGAIFDNGSMKSSLVVVSPLTMLLKVTAPGYEGRSNW